MSENKYTYDAFISYRHTDPDNFIAETLHKMMESFKPPKKILTKEGCSRNKIERVFRDKDELPLASNLEEPIVEALSKSEFLVVICSPRLRESAWCQKEIQTFIEMHGKRKVLAVLAEGEPDESFPEELLYNEVVEKDADGNEIIKRQPVEPLAADFRGKTHKEIKKAMKSEILRLLAPMFNVSYDDLKQRHREQRLKKIIATSILAASLGIAFGVYSTSTAIKLNTQKKKIEEQATKLGLHQSEALAKEALEAFENDDRKSALSIGYAALTEYDGIISLYFHSIF